MKSICVILVLVMIMSLLPPFVTGEGDLDDGGSDGLEVEFLSFSGGSGTEEDPFWISNVEQLQNISANRSAHYILVADLDASATEGWGNGSGFAPIGSYYHKFMGTFDGNGNTVYNLTINRSNSNYQALFGSIGRGSIVLDLVLENPRVRGKAHVGSIVGFSEGKLFSCEAINVTVVGENYVGGMIGYSSWIQEVDCHASGRVVSTSSSAPLIDWNLDPLIPEGQGAGGLIGQKRRGWMTGCSAEVDVKGGRLVGGLAGEASLVNMTDCHSRGEVLGTDYAIGGLIGSYSGSHVGYDKYGTMEHCSFDGKVTGVRDVGGLIGSNHGGKVLHCHATGDVTGTSYNTGGLVGNSQGIYGDCYAIGDVSGYREVGGLFGSHYYSPGGMVIMVTTDLYHIGDVTGTEDRVGGLIGACGGTAYFLRCNASGDVTGRSEVGGLVGSVSRVSFEYCMSTGSVTATQYNAGGLMGYASCGIRYCYSSASVNGRSGAGGLVGDLYGGSISDSHSSGSVHGYDGAAGFVQRNEGSIRNCYSTGRVTSDQYGASAFVGWGNGYVYDSYFDYQTAGTTTSWGGGTARTTAQMMVQSTFTGWNFIDHWRIIEGVTYPYLRGIYHAPIIEPLSEEAAYERQMLSLDYDINISKYPLSNVQTGETFSTDAGPWLSYDPAADRLYGTPTTDDIGTYWINIFVYDNHEGATDYNVTFEVRNVNDVPEILTTPLGAATEDQEYSVDFEATDIDPTNDTLVWSLETDTGWLSINETTGVLNGTPANDDVGSWNVTVTVSDGNGGLNHSKFIVVVNNVNDDPEIMTPDIIDAIEDEEYSVTYEAVDVDPTEDTLTWNFDSDASWLSWDSTTLSGTPSNDDVGTYWVEISVSDGIGGEDVKDFSITVANVNDAPVITTEAVEEATEDVEYRLELIAADVDSDETLAWSLLTAPDWLSMEDGILAGTPGNDDVGSHDVSINVEDGAGATDNIAFTVVVANVNDLPVWTMVPEDLVLIEGEDILLFASATDIDVGDTVTYSLSSDPSSEITIDPDRGILTWFDPVQGSFDIEVVANDGTDSVSYTFKIVIEMLPNAVPEIDPIPDKEVKANTTLSFLVVGSDDDEDSTVFTLEEGPAGIVISSEGHLVWTPTEMQVGNHTIVVALSDWRNTTTAQFKISVLTSATDGEEPDGDDTDDGSDAFWYVLVGLLVMIILALMVLIMRPSPEGPTGSESEDDEDELGSVDDEEDVMVDGEDDEGPESE